MDDTRRAVGRINLFIAQLPAGEDPFDVARRDPPLLQRIIDAAKPAGIWMAEQGLEAPPSLKGWVALP